MIKLSYLYFCLNIIWYIIEDRLKIKICLLWMLLFICFPRRMNDQSCESLSLSILTIQSMPRSVAYLKNSIGMSRLNVYCIVGTQLFSQVQNTHCQINISYMWFSNKRSLKFQQTYLTFKYMRETVASDEEYLNTLFLLYPFCVNNIKFKYGFIL